MDGPIVTYLKTGEQPEDKTEARIFQLKVAHYVLYNDKLYRRGSFMPLLKCVTPSEAKYIMREIHEGTCGNHVGGAIPNIQSSKARLLLANHEDGLHGICQQIQ